MNTNTNPEPMARSTRHPAVAALLLLGTLAATPSAQALELNGEFYAIAGVPGVGLGYARPLDSRFTVRADVLTLGRRDRTTTEDGIQYQSRLQMQRMAVFGDWFPFEGNFRLTGGVSSNSIGMTLDATGAGGTLSIGDRTYLTTAADGLEVRVKFPSVTPYLGIGWGHQLNTGWRLSADLGALIGRAKVTATPRGALASEIDLQVNLDKELSELRSGVGRIRAIPQITVSVGYSFWI
jgi:hypothetical protein